MSRETAIAEGDPLFESRQVRFFFGSGALGGFGKEGSGWVFEVVFCWGVGGSMEWDSITGQLLDERDEKVR